MEEPERLLSGAGSDLERELLRAARNEQPSTRSMQRAAVAVAAATGASTFTKTIWAARELLQPFAAKVAATSVIVGGTAYVAATQLDAAPAEPPAATTHQQAPSDVQTAEATTSPSPKPDSSTEQPAVRLEELEEEPNEAEAEVAAEQSHRNQPKVAAAAAPATKAAKGSIADEVKALDAARRNLDSDNPAGALQKLDAYMRDYRGGSLGQEALVMRIRALVQAGRRAEAIKLANRFRAANPSSPYNKRIDSVVGPSGNR